MLIKYYIICSWGESQYLCLFLILSCNDIMLKEYLRNDAMPVTCSGSLERKYSTDAPSLIFATSHF